MCQAKIDAISNLRAIITTSKGGLPLVDVQNDYYEAFGERVPVNALGYDSLRDLFLNHPSDFYIIGDKVEVVEKSNSAHIRSLINRQKFSSRGARSLKNTRNNQRPRVQNVPSVNSKKPDVNIELPAQFTKGNKSHAFDIKNVSKHLADIKTDSDSTEKTRLRKQKTSRMPDIIQPMLSAKPKTETKTTVNLRPVTKAVTGGEFVRQKIPSSETEWNLTAKYTEPFQNIEDQPVSTGVQSRLLRHRIKISQDFNATGTINNTTAAPGSCEASELLFDIKPITPTSINNSSSSPHGIELNSTSRIELKAPDPLFHQKAQARIAHIRSSMQNLMLDKTSPRDEVKDKNGGNSDFETQRRQNDGLQCQSVGDEPGKDLELDSAQLTKPSTSSLSDDNFENRKIEKETLILRILDIVSSSYGVWSDKLSVLYNKHYNEIIPENWFNVIQQSPLFHIDNFDSKRFIIRKNMQDPKPAENADCIQNKELELQKLPELKLPNSEHWEIYITNINNSDEIWCRLIGEEYSDAYDAMMTELELKSPRRKTTEPKVGGLYNIKLLAMWYRVEIVELTSELQGLAFFIDIGDRDVVDLTQLYEPEEFYFSVAPQAIMFSLYELGPFSDDERVIELITNNLLGKTYIGEIMSEVDKVKAIPRTVRLWDTSTEQDVNVNQLLLNTIIKEMRTPSLPPPSQIKEVYVSYINENGYIYIQTDQVSLRRLKCLIINKLKALEGKPANRGASYTAGTDIFYLTKCSGNDAFCRAKLIEIHKSTDVDVMCIDYGCVERISISKLIELERCSILQAIPAQAVRVKLASAKSMNRSGVAKLREIILHKNVLMKVNDFNRGNTPCVEFFRRSNSANNLCSVKLNNTNDLEFINFETPEMSKSVVLGLEKVLPENLRAPDIPKIGSHFEVFVTLASSPDLFIVQPLSSKLQFMEMMNEMQEVYNKNVSTMTMNDFVVGELYAVLHPDGSWYRGCAQAVVGSYSYSVYLCDFGDCIMVTADKLKCLSQKFKTFPYQAIRAKLLGIPPEHRDWTPTDCVNFHKLVVEKYFVSTVMEITKDEENPNYVKLGLILTDTSKDEDILIHEVLLEKKKEIYSLSKD